MLYICVRVYFIYERQRSGVAPKSSGNWAEIERKRPNRPDLRAEMNPFRYLGRGVRESDAAGAGGHVEKISLSIFINLCAFCTYFNRLLSIFQHKDAGKQGEFGDKNVSMCKK